ISPLSNTAAIFDSGFSAASLSFLASKRGLRASHIFNLASGSGNAGSSGSTTMCFLSRVHPLSFPFRPFGFRVGLASTDGVGVSAVTAFLEVEDAVDVVDFVQDSAAGASVGEGAALAFRQSLSLMGRFVFSKGLLVLCVKWAETFASLAIAESCPSLLEFESMFVLTCGWECTCASWADIALAVDDFISGFGVLSVTNVAEG
uniref:Uncharacterized protein n=1 Tax=Echeneis naucrates TaxID=173247 RepID=A0A665WTB1_ECHNA